MNVSSVIALCVPALSTLVSEKLGNIESGLAFGKLLKGGRVQRRIAVLVYGIHVRPDINQLPGHFHTPQSGCPVKRCAAVFILGRGVDIGAFVDKKPSDLTLIGQDRYM